VICIRRLFWAPRLTSRNVFVNVLERGITIHPSSRMRRYMT
jgi:hypothetical protein